MTAEALIAPLRRVAIFHGLDDDQLARIARSAERIVFRDGDTLIEEDEEGDAAFLIVSGGARLTHAYAPHLPPQLIEPGCLVGEMAMLTEVVHGASIAAAGVVRALKITRAGLLELMEVDPSLAEHFIGKITARLQDVADELRRIDDLLAPAELAPAELALEADAASTDDRTTFSAPSGFASLPFAQQGGVA
ncbi:MAG: cyclic nucleotide-binding domain-containing protein [Hyphomicrobiaceae bacterium]|nr:cyclic nucleotide-binding domain-containing protein [Hyphomicrobiaceae bacterium]